jgi:hypothetical protein
MKDNNMNNSYSASGHIEAWCPRCNLKSGHTIIAIVDNSPKKIKCNTCDEHHNLSAKPSGKSLNRESRAKEVMYVKYLTLLTGSDPANSKKYNTKGNFEKDEIIDHLRFGIGIVLSVIQVNKIKILFKDGPRLLIQNQ